MRHNFPNFHKHLLGSLRLLSNLDFVHNLALTRVRLRDAESETVLLLRIHRPGEALFPMALELLEPAPKRHDLWTC